MKLYMKKWKEENPGYFNFKTNPGYVFKVRQAVKNWREVHPDYQKKYRQRNRKRYNEYMKNYMHHWRIKNFITTETRSHREK
ncbi:MAG: hypothetical protein AB1349_13075 [Elusimicrobiota bacterium]